MPSSLPPEIHDLIVDHLHDEPTTLKSCCVVSKSWVPRARKYFFARVEFRASKSHIELWKKAFPDPSNSPAYHTRTLYIYGIPVVAATDVGVDSWIRAFHNVVHLYLDHLDQASLIPFYGLSPTVRSLRLSYTTPEVFGLICSFPLLEHLALVASHTEDDADQWDAPLTSPKLTGFLDLRMFGSARPVLRRLLDLPGGLHFSKISTLFISDATESVTDLVSRCSDTLEVLVVLCLPLSVFPSAPATGQHLTLTRGRRHAWSSFARPFQGHKTQRSEVYVGKANRSVDYCDTSNRQFQTPQTYHHLPGCRPPRRFRGSS